MVLIGEAYVAARLHSFEWNGRLAAVDPNAIDGILFKVCLETVLQSISGTQEDDEHEDAPEHAETSKERAKLVLANGFKYLLPFI